MILEHIFTSPGRDPWPFIERVHIDTSLEENHCPDEWANMLSVTPEQLLDMCQEAHASASILVPDNTLKEPSVIISIFSEEILHEVASFHLARVHCKGGLFLKRPFDIAELFFEDYNPMVNAEYERWLWRGIKF